MQRTVDLTDMRTPGPTRSPTVALHEDHPSPTDDPPVQEKRRKGTGSLRVSQNQSSIQEDLSEHQRQMQVDSRSFPKRKKVGKSLQTSLEILAVLFVVMRHTILAPKISRLPPQHD
jgi:hypothetical protein